MVWLPTSRFVCEAAVVGGVSLVPSTDVRLPRAHNYLLGGARELGPLSAVMSGTPIFSSKPLATSDSFVFRSVPLCRASDLSLPPRNNSRFAFCSLADADAGRSVPAAAVVTAFEMKSRRHVDVWNARAVSAEAHIARMANRFMVPLNFYLCRDDLARGLLSLY